MKTDAPRNVEEPGYDCDPQNWRLHGTQMASEQNDSARNQKRAEA